MQNNGGDLFRYLQDSTSDEISDRTSKFSTSFATKTTKNDVHFASSTRKKFCGANISGGIQKIKNIKRSRPVISGNIQKFPAGSKTSNREIKVIVSKIITTHVQPKCKPITSTHKKIGENVKSIFSKKSQKSNKAKAAEKNSRIKLSVKHSVKISAIYAKRAIIKKQATQKLKPTALSNVRHKLQIELGESSKKINTKLPLTSPKNQKLMNNFITKKKKQPIKLEHKSPKKSSTPKT